MNEPNIGIRLKTPVIRPNGRARPGLSPKIKLIMKIATMVKQALIKATVIALDT